MVELELRPLQRYIQAHGFHPLTEHEVFIITHAFHLERDKLRGISVETLTNLGPAFGIEQIIQAMVDAFYLVRNVSKEW